VELRRNEAKIERQARLFASHPGRVQICCLRRGEPDLAFAWRLGARRRPVKRKRDFAASRKKGQERQDFFFPLDILGEARSHLQFINRNL
jgi:hypothetical protein